MFPGMKAQEITALFTETDTLGYTKLKAVSIKTIAQSQDEALARLDRAFTSWMFDKDEGKDVWERSEGLFNIDAALRCFNTTERRFQPPALSGSRRDLSCPGTLQRGTC